ncbi:MAG: TlpA disulfide reductase family protein [Dermatophilaceae bacterium]
MRSRRRALGLLVACVLAAGATAGCAQQSELEKAQQDPTGARPIGDGAVQTVAVGQRSGPVTLAGPLLDGTRWSLDDQRGKVVVVNKWGTWCPPCVAEMPLLQRAWVSLRAPHPDVRFVGLNVRESAATAQAGARSFGITFPSLSDESDTLSLGLQGAANLTPTTLVLDRQGRIAVRISGEVTSESTLRGLVEDVAAET